MCKDEPIAGPHGFCCMLCLYRKGIDFPQKMVPCTLSPRYNLLHLFAKWSPCNNSRYADVPDFFNG